MAGYLNGITRENLHKLWLLKQAARKRGHRSVTIVGLVNALLNEALADTDELTTRFGSAEGGTHGAEAPVHQ